MLSHDCKKMDVSADMPPMAWVRNRAVGAEEMSAPCTMFVTSACKENV
jgi:hypothetical protein